MILKKILFIVCVLQINSNVFAQAIPYVSRMDTLFSIQNTNQYYKPAASSNELVIVFNMLYKGYKKYISSQDNQSCSFTPSCSEYANMAIHKHGIMKGLLMAFDRLQRCNGFKSARYPIHPKHGLKIDPA